MFAEINAMPVSAFQSSNVAKSEISIGENVKYLDAILDLPAMSVKMRGICEELLPRLMHAINLVQSAFVCDTASGGSTGKLTCVLWCRQQKDLSAQSKMLRSTILFWTLWGI